MDKKEREDLENKEQNGWVDVDRLKQNVSRTIQYLNNSLQDKLFELGREVLQGRISQLTLEDLAKLTRSIGNGLNPLLFSITAIAAELLRRIRESGSTVEVTVKAGSIVRVEKILSTMSKEEIEAAIKRSKDDFDKSNAPSKSLTFSISEPQSSKAA